MHPEVGLSAWTLGDYCSPCIWNGPSQRHCPWKSCGPEMSKTPFSVFCDMQGAEAARIDNTMSETGCVNCKNWKLRNSCGTWATQIGGATTRLGGSSSGCGSRSSCSSGSPAARWGSERLKLPTPRPTCSSSPSSACSPARPSTLSGGGVDSKNRKLLNLGSPGLRSDYAAWWG